MAYTNSPVPNARSSEMATAYFKDRLLAISADLSAVKSAHAKGLMAKNEFVGIRRSLMRAKQEVQAALDSINQRTHER